MPFFIGIVSGALLLGAWFSFQGTVETPNTEETVQSVSGTKTAPASEEGSEVPVTNESEQSFTDGAQTLTIQDQPAGSTVTITNASLAQNGWIVVHEEILDGIIGNALGATRKDAGVYANVTVELLRPTEAGRRYWATIYTDNGDKIFSLRDDTPVVGTSQELLLAEFTATTP